MTKNQFFEKYETKKHHVVDCRTPVVTCRTYLYSFLNTIKTSTLLGVRNPYAPPNNKQNRAYLNIDRHFVNTSTCIIYMYIKVQQKWNETFRLGGGRVIYKLRKATEQLNNRR